MADRSGWAKMFKSLREEMEYEITDVEGHLPRGLCGTFWRNGPGFTELGGVAIHPVDGDGMVCRIAIRDGRATFKNKYIQTAGFTAEQKAQKVLFRGVYGTVPSDPKAAAALQMGEYKNVANTSVLEWGGKMWAQWEGGLPHAFRPDTLETIGVEKMGGAFRDYDFVTAHPRVDSRRQRLITFGASPGGMVNAWEFDDNNNLVQKHEIELKRPHSLMHSMAVSANHIIIVQASMSFDIEGLMGGKKGIDELITSDPSQDTLFYIIPRFPFDGSQDSTKVNSMAKVLTCGRLFCYHFVNAFEDETTGDITLDAVDYVAKPPLDMRDTEKGGNTSGDFPGRMNRYILPTKGTAPPRMIPHSASPTSCEMPQVRPGLECYPHRFVYIVDTSFDLRPDGTPGSPWTSLSKVDVHTQKKVNWYAPPQHFIGEVMFAPDPQGNQEDSGWLLTLCFNATTEKTSLLVLDARDPEAGPVARLHLRTHIPFSFHCGWTDRHYSGPTARL